MDSYEILESIILFEGKTIYDWYKLLDELKDYKEK